MAQKDDLNVGRITLIALVSGLVVVAIIMFLQVLYYGYHQGMMASPKYDQLPAEMANYVADQRGKLVTIRVVDQQREVVTIPIDDAQRLVIDELLADPEARVTGVADPEPAPPGEEPATGDKPADDIPAKTGTQNAGDRPDSRGETESQGAVETAEGPPDKTTPAPSDPALDDSAPAGGDNSPKDQPSTPADENSPPIDDRSGAQEVSDDES
jgi:hypothetical protein